RYFLETARKLGPKLGPILFQLPPNFKKDLDRLNDLLTQFPADLRCAWEFRHESWFGDDVYEALRVGNAALCVADTENGHTPLVGLNAPRQLPHAAGRGARVAALEDAPAPQHVVDQEQSTRSQLGHDDVECLRVILFVDVVEDDVERPGSASQGRHRLPHVELDHVGQAEGREVVARFAGQPLVPDDMVHRPAAVFFYGAREPRGRIAEPRADLDVL